MCRDQTIRDVNDRARKATMSKRFTLSEDPLIRYDFTGFPMALFRSDDMVAISKPIEHEDEQQFISRISQIASGDEIVAHGHFERRSWKDGNGKWQGTNEFMLDKPIAPDNLKHELPSGVVFPETSFAKDQRDLAARSAGIGM